MLLLNITKVRFKMKSCKKKFLQYKFVNVKIKIKQKPSPVSFMRLKNNINFYFII